MHTKEDEDQLDTRTIIAFSAMVIGMFMAILDIQIVASSLSVIGAGLSASGDELSWIQTSYLIAEVIIIPITGFASRLLSTRIFFFIAALGFTVMSLLCSLAWNIESMIIFRALQGLFGGAMIPTAFGAVFIIFPKKLHTKVGIIIGLTVTVAPTLGPTLGGYITEIISWHFMFLINIIPGIFVCAIVLLYVDFDKPNYKLLHNFDFLGTFLMVIALGGLQYVLEEGNKKQWFEDSHILILSIVVLLSFIGLIIRELSFSNPIINLYAFKNINFTFGCIYSFILGVGLYGSVYLLPLFMFRVAGYNTLQIGVAMIVTGAFQFISAPLAGKMFDSGIDKRFVLATGFGAFSLGCYLNSFLTAESAYWEFFIPQMVRGLSLMFCFMPINDLALGTMPKDEVQDASGLYNLTRNLGGAIGLALINSIIINKTKVFSQAIRDEISAHSSQSSYYVQYIKQGLSNQIKDPELAALQMFDNIINQEAFIIAINNVFIIIASMFFLGMLLIPFSKPPKEVAG